MVLTLLYITLIIFKLIHANPEKHQRNEYNHGCQRRRGRGPVGRQQAAAELEEDAWPRRTTRRLTLATRFCFLKKLSGVRKLTTFYFAKNDHRWVTFISLKTINGATSILNIDLDEK